MEKFNPVSAAAAVNVDARNAVEVLRYFIVKTWQSRRDLKMTLEVSSLTFIYDDASSSLGVLKEFIPDLDLPTIVDHVLELMAKEGFVNKTGREGQLHHWLPCPKLLSMNIESVPVLNPMTSKGPVDVKQLQSQAEHTATVVKATLEKQVDFKDYQKALEVIALYFVDKKIDEAERSMKSTAPLLEAAAPVLMLKRVRGTIMDHGLEFRLTKSAAGEYGVPSRISHVQLVKTLYPMEADLLESILSLFYNKGH